MIPQTNLDAELSNKPETLEVEKTTVIGVASTDNTYVIQIDKTVLWIFLFVINYPMLREIPIFLHRLFN